MEPITDLAESSYSSARICDRGIGYVFAGCQSVSLLPILMNPVNPRCFLIAVFVAMILFPPLLQTAIEAARGEWPRALQPLARWPSTENLRAFEKEVQDASVAARALRPWMQAALFFALRDAGEKALVGRDGWLFYQPGVSY